MADEPTPAVDPSEQVSQLEQEIERLSGDLDSASQQSKGDGANWQGSFSDMVSLLLCFFIVMTAIMAIKQGDPFAVSAVIAAMQEQGDVPQDILARQEFIKKLERLGETDPNVAVQRRADRVRIIISNVNLNSSDLGEADANLIALFDGRTNQLTVDAERLLLLVATELLVPPDNTVDVNTFIQILDQTFTQVRIEGHTDGQDPDERDRDSDPGSSFFASNWEISFVRANNVRYYFQEGIKNFPPELLDKISVVACADQLPLASEEERYLFSLPPDWIVKLDTLSELNSSDNTKTNKGAEDRVDLSNIFSASLLATDRKGPNIVELSSNFDLEKIDTYKHKDDYSILKRRNKWKIVDNDNPHSYFIRQEELSQLSISDNNDKYLFSIDPRSNDFLYQIQYLASNPERKGGRKARESSTKYRKSLTAAFSLRGETLSEKLEVSSKDKDQLWHLVDKKKGETYHIRNGNLNVYGKRPEEDDSRQLARGKNNRIEIHLIIND